MWGGRQMTADRPQDVRPEALIAAFVDAAGWDPDAVTPSTRAGLRSLVADLPPGTTAADVERAVQLWPAVCAGIELSPYNMRGRWSELHAWAAVLRRERGT